MVGIIESVMDTIRDDIPLSYRTVGLPQSLCGRTERLATEPPRSLSTMAQAKA